MLTSKDKAIREMQEFGLDIGYDIKIDTSGIVRVKFNEGKKHNIAGFYKVSTYNDKVFGFFGTWYGGKEVRTFTHDGSSSTMSAQQIHVFKKELEAKNKEVKEFEPDLGLWALSPEAKEHPYLTKKGITGEGLRVAGYDLLIPYQKLNGKISGVQIINPNGDKRMIKGSKMSGAFHEIKGSDVIAICEGFATGHSINQATGWTVICAYSCSNIVRVAGYFKHRRLIICADNDHATLKRTGKNPGLDAANEASIKYKCPVVNPPNHDILTDFNDWPLENVKDWLCARAPKTLIDQILELEDASAKERFIIDRRELIGNYPPSELEYLMNRLVEIGITKSLVKAAIKGVKSEEDLEEMREAEDKLKMFRRCESGYWCLDEDRFFNVSSKEIDLLVKMASDNIDSKKQELLNDLHKTRNVSRVEVVPVPVGKSKVDEFMDANNNLIVRQMVSIQDVLEAEIAKIKDDIDLGFIEYLQTNYSEAIDCIKASLARKFITNKKSFVYFNCSSSYGKTFLFDLPISYTFDRVYDKEEMKGDSPESFVRPIFFFVDEANSFPASYKMNVLPYRRIYQGMVSVELGLRILACANPIRDLEAGIDEQIAERVVTIKPTQRRLDHCGIERNKSHRIYTKWILGQLSNLLNTWSINGKFNDDAEAYYQGFLDKYDKKTKDLVELGEVIRHCIDLAIDHQGKCQYQFSDHIFKIDSDHFCIRSPMKTIKEAIRYFEDDRFKAFSSRYGSLKELCELKFLTGPNNDQKKGVISYDVGGRESAFFCSHLVYERRIHE